MEILVYLLIGKWWSFWVFFSQFVLGIIFDMFFEVVSWAVSVFNEQFWQYIYVYYVDEVGFNCLLFCFNEGNQAWVKDVGVLVLSLVQFNLSCNGCFNWYYMYDIGVVNINLLLQVVDLDIYGYMMGGFDYGKIIVEFDLN